MIYHLLFHCEFAATQRMRGDALTAYRATTSAVMLATREREIDRTQHAHRDVSVAHEDRCLFSDALAFHLQ